MAKRPFKIQSKNAIGITKLDNLLTIVNPICLYCEANCAVAGSWYEHGALFIDKEPLGLGLSLKIDPSLFGKQLSLAFQIQDKTTGAALFENAWDALAQFEEQWSWLQWNKTPPEIAALTPGPYKYFGVALELETGAYSEKTRIVFARRKP